MGKRRKLKNHEKVQKIKCQLKIEPPYQKDHKLGLKSHYFVLTPPPPFGGEVGGKTPQNGIFGNFQAIFRGVPKFTGQNECHHRLQRPKTSNSTKFHLGAKKKMKFCWAVNFLIIHFVSS